MRRRLFLAALLAAGLPARAQSRAPRRIVLIGAQTDDMERRLRQLGFVAGRDILVERPHWDCTADHVRRIAGAAVSSRADVIVTCGALPTQAAMEATRTIPVVMAYGGDPVVMKLAPSLARPGGNLTGLAWSASESIAAKAAEIFKEAIPAAEAFALFGYAEDPGHQYLAKEAQAAMGPLGVRYVDLLIRTREEFEPAFHKALAAGAAGVIGIPDHMTGSLAEDLDRLARARRVPILWGVGSRPSDRVLLTFGPDVDDHEKRAGDYVAKILAGARPGDLPIEQTRRIVLGVNLKTAARLNLRIPERLVNRADEVVQSGPS